MVPSASLRTRAERVSRETVLPDDLREASGDCCPYEVMLHAARGADVVILEGQGSILVKAEGVLAGLSVVSIWKDLAIVDPIIALVVVLAPHRLSRPLRRQCPSFGV
jgi:hypothetical protein